MDIEHLIINYGYLAVFFGTLVEGETILMMGGFAAQLGYLRLEWVIAIAMLGSVMGDQMFFFLGRLFGRRLIERYPKLHTRTDKARAFLDRYSTAAVFMCRFLYGFRIVTPLALGMTRVSTAKFCILNVVSAFVWSVVVTLIGYLFGALIKPFFDDIRTYSIELLIGIAAVGGLIWFWHFLRSRRARRDLVDTVEKRILISDADKEVHNDPKDGRA